jgi:hypothetical protein
MVSATKPDSKNRIVTGVAISPTALCAADIRLRSTPDRSWRVDLQPPPADGGSWSSLASALMDLARAVGASGGTLAVSLMPPLTEVRRLELPPLRDDELQRYLSRNAAKYFVNARTPQIVGASPAAKRVRGAPLPVVATAASARLVATIRAAAQQAGWTVDSVAPAESAWAAVSLALWPAFTKQNAWALIAHDDRTDLLQVDMGRLVGVRRFRAGAADAALIADTVGPAPRIGVVGAPAMRRDLASALAGKSVTLAVPTGEWSTSADRPDLLAANFAGREVGPVLRTEDAVVVARAEAKKAAWLVAAGAAALLLLSAGVELWGVHRQLRLVREERARIRPQIAATMVGRTTVDATSRHLAMLNGVERNSPQWSAIITTLSQAITDDAYLTAVRARGDSLIIDGLAEHASRVFDALQKTKILADVKSAAPVRRELQEDGTALDHFTIAARIIPPAASPPTAAPVSSRPRADR